MMVDVTYFCNFPDIWNERDEFTFVNPSEQQPNLLNITQRVITHIHP